MNIVRFFCAALLLFPTMAWAEISTTYPGTGPNVELRISIDRRPVLGERDMESLERKGLVTNTEQAGAIYEANIVPITMGRSLQLKVEMIEADGTITDVTHSPATLYDVIGERGDLKTNASGLITAAFRQEKILLTGAVFIIYGTPEKSGYNKIFFGIKRP
ncbi:hypothetical protein [Paraherbaspirillum soli]|uniref:DUF4402 domain-containing protein n=1 Tax=Paraherbaspirillum soli TaxID=631222 RepID=A0ABW0M377_9BURK